MNKKGQIDILQKKGNTNDKDQQNLLKILKIKKLKK